VILFLDSSALVKRYVREAGTEVLLDLIQRSAFVVASRLTWLEVTSAVTRRARGSALLRADEVIRALDDDFSVVIDIIDVTGSVIADARGLARRHGLRAGDAVQLASAKAAETRYAARVSVICSDKKLLATARQEGFETVDPAP
jgi:predicted nucleic acid-binding protein